MLGLGINGLLSKQNTCSTWFYTDWSQVIKKIIIRSAYLSVNNLREDDLTSNHYSEILIVLYKWNMNIQLELITLNVKRII